MPTHNEFGVDLEALRKAETGVRDAVNELSGLIGFGGAETAEEGSGLVSAMMDEAPSVGHDLLMAGLIDFGMEWDWGLRYLIDDGNAAADALGETRSTYQQVEDSVTGFLGRLVHIAVGDPSKSYTEAQNDGQFWGY